MGHSHSTRRATRPVLQAAAMATLALLTMGAQAQGSTPRTQESSYGNHLATEYALTNFHATSNSIHLLGDYYFFDPAQGSATPLLGGLRASTGIVGLGYSHLYFNSQLSLNADFGRASQNHGRGLFNSASSLDDVTSQLRWAPVMAVNVRYSF